jgi:outer membrane protein TolC
MNRVYQYSGLRWIVRGAPMSALLLAGCVAAPDVRAPSLASPEAALRARAVVVANEDALVDASAPSEWWQLFGDATLTALQAEAAASNLDLQAAVARIEESRAQLGLANAARWPQLSAEVSYARSALSENSPMAALGAPTHATDNWSLGLQAAWELDLWGHLRSLNESAEARLYASAYGMEAVKVSIAATWREPICSCAASRRGKPFSRKTAGSPKTWRA